MSEPCISKIPITTTVFLYDAIEELQQLPITQGIPIFAVINLIYSSR